MNNIWESEAKVTAGIWGMLRERVLSFGMVLSLLHIAITIAIIVGIIYLCVMLFGRKKVAY